ncbi:MAG: LysR family transcriptional regulator [Bacteroidales bacterium]|nr:LysR family transcriptional regulator [Bacteroidales bacterium]
MIQDFRLLVFKTTAQLMSFSLAAKQLGISQPAVSQHIRELEKQCRQPLFTRKGTRIQLTPFAQEILPLITEITLRYQQLNQKIEVNVATTHHSLRLGATPTLARYLLPSLMATLHKTQPALRVSMTTLDNEAISKALLTKEIDYGFTEDEDPYDGLTYEPLQEDSQLLVTVNGAVRFVSADEIDQLPRISTQQLGSIEAVISYLRQTDTYAFLPQVAIQEELQTQRMRRVPTDAPTLHRQYFLVHHPEHEATIGDLIKSILITENETEK